MTTVPEERTRRARRFDPHRRERILDAAVAMIAEHGVAGTTHRLIAAAADVPLGSLTYHFTGLEDLRAQAFRRLSERLSAVYESHFDGVRTDAELVEAVTDLVHAAVGADAGEWAVTYELYLAALRDPALRDVTESWMRTSRRVLERFVDPDTARGVDALIEGLVMHRMLSTAPPARAFTREAVRRFVAGATSPTGSTGAAGPTNRTSPGNAAASASAAGPTGQGSVAGRGSVAGPGSVAGAGGAAGQGSAAGRGSAAGPTGAGGAAGAAGSGGGRP